MIEYLGTFVLEDEIAELQRRRHAIIVCDGSKLISYCSYIQYIFGYLFINLKHNYYASFIMMFMSTETGEQMQFMSSY